MPRKARSHASRARGATGPPLRAILSSPKTSCVNLLLEVADDGGLSSASRSACDRPSGDGRAGHPLGGGEVGHWARRGWDGDGDVAL